MPDRRALLTEREREIVAGEADVSDAYRYQTISRVRSRFDRLDEDLAALEAHGELADDLRAKVCGPESDATDRPAETHAGSERRESAHNRSEVDRDPADVPTDAASAADSPASEDGDETLDPDTDSLDFPANKDVIACINATAAAKKFIRENGAATKAQLVENVMPEHAVGYDAEAALEKLEAGERFRGAWWRRVVKPGLEADDEVEKPGPGGSEWRYVGDN